MQPLLASTLRAIPLALALALALAGCGPGVPDEPSIVLVTLDTTRWDRLGAYGDPAARTPFLDATARAGRQYRFAFVDVPTTLPSHATMLTGAVSLRHGLRLNDAGALSPDARTLAEILAENGWETAAVLSSVTLAAERGLDQGFATYDDEMPPEFEGHDPTLAARTARFVGLQRRASQTTEAARRALAGLEAPAFLWAHYVDAHLTYDPPPPWDRIHAGDPYAGEIAFADREMGRMLRAAEARLGPTVVAILSDHGEGLGDHREDEHGMFLYDSTVRVPFVLAGPGVAPGLDVRTVRTVDLAPTLLALVGIEDEDFPDGVDHGAATSGAATSGAASPGAAGAVRSGDDALPVFLETLTPTRFHGGSRVKALRRGDRKYVLAPEPELYDLAADPGEVRNLLEGDRAGAANGHELAAELRAIVAGIGRDPAYARAVASGVDAEAREALRALGYVAAGEAVPVAPETTAVGIDPKDLVDVTRSVRYVMDGRYDEARPRMARFWREHPSPPDPTWHELFSRAYLVQAFLELTDLSRESGHRERAEASLAEALRYDPGYDHALALKRRLEEMGE